MNFNTVVFLFADIIKGNTVIMVPVCTDCTVSINTDEKIHK